jgi:putative peptidoglycan lipid II flippase
MLAIVTSQLMGLLRGIVVAQAFGAAPELDAFFAANRVSETLFLLIAGGALGSAFIPTFSGLLATSRREAAWRLASAIANVLILILTLLGALAAWLAPQIVRYALAPGFSADAALFTLTVSLLRIQLISVVLFGLGGLVVGILNAHHVFLLPALTPAMYQAGIIVGALWLAPSMGAAGLAWGVVLGAGLYLLLQVPSLLRRRGRYHLTLGSGDQAVARVLLLMGPRLLGVAVVQLNFWVNTWLASQMAAGSVTGLYYGFSLMLMAQAAIAQSVAIAALPTFSAQHALGKVDELRRALATSLRGVALLALPASIGLALLRGPLIGFLYERGEFTDRAVVLVAWPLLWYAAGLLGHSLMEVLTRAFYAQQDTRTPVIIGTVAMGLNVVLSVTLAELFARVGWMPHGGLALANSLATALEATVLFVVMRRRLRGLEDRQIGLGLGAAALAGLGMAIALTLWVRGLGNLADGLVTVGGVAVGAIVYGLALWLMGVREVRSLAAVAANRLSRLIGLSNLLGS